MRPAKAYRILLGGLLSALLVGPAVHACHVTTNPVNWMNWEDALTVYVEAQSATSGPLLSLDPKAGAVGVYTAFDATTGVASGVQHMAGGSRETKTFTLAAPLDRTHYLNLSKPINGVFWWSTTTTQAASRDPVNFRFELFKGTERIAGDECVTGAYVAIQAWNPVYIRLRPEVAILEKGSIITLKVTRLAGNADLQIGTDGNYQSYFQFRTFPYNPLSGAVYLQDRRLVLGEPAAESGPQGDAPGAEATSSAWQAVAGLSFLGMAGLALAHPKARRQTVPWLVVLLLATMGLAGCVGGEAKGEGDATDDELLVPTARIDEKDDETLLAKGHGAIKGNVTDQFGIVIRAAHVVLLGTDLFTRTDSRGRFEFPNVTANTYLLRADKEGFLPLEKEVVVGVGKLVTVSVTLTKQGKSFEINHIHDYWSGETQREQWSANVVLRSYPYQAAIEQSGNVICPNAYAQFCEQVVPIQVNQPVIPGSGHLEVSLSWTPPAYGFKELGLRIVTAKNSSTDQRFIVRGPSEKFQIPFFPDEADPGHQTHTTWQLSIVVPLHNLYNPYAPPATVMTTKVHVQAVARKTVVPYEPPHNNHWGNKTSVLLVDNSKKGPGSTLTPVDFPYTSSSSYYWSLGSGLLVPAGTKEIRGTLTWTGPQGQNVGSNWYVAYKGADSNFNNPILHFPPDQAVSGQKNEFVIKPAPNQLDQAYQKSSLWRFYMDDRMDQIGGSGYSANTQYGTTWYLTATVHKDPAWQDS